MKISIKLSNGSVFEEVFDLPRVIIGRSQKCDIVVGDQALSRQHCLLENENGNLFITDLGSANGVYLNGARIPPHERTPFNSFFPAQLSNLEFQVTFQDQPQSIQQTNTSPKRPIPASDEASSMTKTIHSPKITSRTSLPRHKKKIIQKSRLTLQLSILAFLGVIGLFIYLSLEEPSSTSEGPGAVKLPDRLQQTPDVFLSQSDYLQRYAQRACPSAEVCKELNIDPSGPEGITQTPKEVFIFLSTSKLDNLKLDRIQDERERRILAGLTRVFEAKIFKDRFFNQKLAQVHVVILGPNHQPSTVVRFHSKNLSRSSISIFNGLHLAKSFANFSLLLERATPLMQIKDFRK